MHRAAKFLELKSRLVKKFRKAGGKMASQNFIDSDIKEKIEAQLGEIDHLTAVRWAADCAEHVLSYYEQLFPKDQRLKNAIEAAHLWTAGKIKVKEARQAAFEVHAAAREATDDAAAAVARAAGQAVSTAHMAEHAIHASTYAVKSVAFAEDFDEDAVEEERKWQYQRLLELS